MKGTTIEVLKLEPPSMATNEEWDDFLLRQYQALLKPLARRNETMSEIKTVDITIPITLDNLPEGPHWDADGACFVAERCNPITMGCEWRWVARNPKALAKGTPDYPLYDHPPIKIGLPSPDGK